MVEGKSKLKEFFLKKPVSFSDKRDINWAAARNVCFALLGIAVVAILLMPARQDDQSFQNGEKSRPVETDAPLDQAPPTADTRAYRSAMGYGGSGGSGSTRNRASGMIVSREGVVSQTQLPPGSRIRVGLTERVIVSTQAMPVIGIVLSDCEQDGVVAIPKGSKLFGDISYDPDSKRGQLSWRSIQLANGRIRQFDAISTSSDGQAGVAGKVHSDALKNTIGQTMTRFVGAYAEGSMERTAFMGSPGGKQNGFKNAVAETAKDQADRMADGLKKEREWLELNPGQEFFAILTQSFRFRDPGGAYR